jgi:hypothetical protein
MQRSASQHMRRDIAAQIFTATGMANARVVGKPLSFACSVYGLLSFHDKVLDRAAAAGDGGICFRNVPVKDIEETW